jgi:Arc/MetJ family transcription regulator
VITMRPTLIRLPDEALAPACRALGIEVSPSDLSDALRAAVQAVVRAQMNPNPKARRFSQTRAVSGQQVSFGFDDRCVDIKRRAANDFDEE